MHLKITREFVNAVKTIEKMLLVHDGELDIEQLQATYLTVGRVIEARQVRAMHPLCFSYQTAALLLLYGGTAHRRTTFYLH